MKSKKLVNSKKDTVIEEIFINLIDGSIIATYKRKGKQHMPSGSKDGSKDSEAPVEEVQVAGAWTVDMGVPDKTKAQVFAQLKELRNIGRPTSSPESDEDLPAIMQVEKDTEQNEENLEQLRALKFGKDAEILAIGASNWRIMCYFLDTNSPKHVSHTSSAGIPIVILLSMQAISQFMKEKGYIFAGELAFDQHGSIIPVGTCTWEIREDEITFTESGYLFFEAPNEEKEKNMVFSVGVDRHARVGAVHCFSKDKDLSKKTIVELTEFSKDHNCLRGHKIRDLNIFDATFKSVPVNGSHTWDNFYYPDNIKTLFELEVFGFLDNAEKYNKKNIKKRGVLLHGPPGTGKTSIGLLTCNYAEDHTVIWITPELVAQDERCISMLYTLASYLSPVVVILEDIDLFSEDRDTVVESVRLGALLNVLDGVNSVKNAVTIAMTNRLNLIEKALSNRPGRFDRVIKIPPLDKELCSRMLKDRLKEFKLAKGVFDLLVDETTHSTGAELQEVVNSINMHFISHDLKPTATVTIKMVKDILSTIGHFSLGSNKKPMGFEAEGNNNG
tara:strand:+ start:804 stop:2474 length:1671 start_codon:yes stop_codon:yes gene_type:complete